MENKEIYQALYDEFMQSYKMGSVNAEQVGEIIARLAGYFSNFNLMATHAERAFAVVSKEKALQTDELTGKPITSAKAETLSLASDEAYRFNIAKTHVTNLEMLIGGLKFLQKGLIQDFNQSNLN